MLASIDKRETGIQLRRLMDERGLTVRDVQQVLRISSIQSVYHWINGISLPTLDKLYALSELLQVSVDELVSCHRQEFPVLATKTRERRLSAYGTRLQQLSAI